MDCEEVIVSPSQSYDSLVETFLFPSEIWSMILQNFYSIDLDKVSQVSKFFYFLVFSYLVIDEEL